MAPVVMLASAEVRWFFRGAPSAEDWRWFRDGELWFRQPPRVDEYLVLPDCTTTGIKLREGRFEVKALTDAPRIVEYPHGVRGHRDGWVKWSRALDTGSAAGPFPPQDDERWVRVLKRRTLRGFSLDGIDADGDPREVSAEEQRPRRGCGVEITEVRIFGNADSPWWTVGLEGFDDDGAVDDALERVARYFFSIAPPARDLDRDASRSYVEWLARITR